jgi:hypothetical protein
MTPANDESREIRSRIEEEINNKGEPFLFTFRDRTFLFARPCVVRAFMRTGAGEL